MVTKSTISATLHTTKAPSCGKMSIRISRDGLSDSIRPDFSTLHPSGSSRLTLMHSAGPTPVCWCSLAVATPTQKPAG